MTAPARPVPRLPGPYSLTEAIDRILIVAASQIGYREGRAPNGTWNNDNAYGAWYGTNRVSWCAQWVSWIANRAGYLGRIIPKHQYTPTGWSWFAARNRDVAKPRRGDLVYIYGHVPGETKPRVHHVGIVERVLAGGYIQTIEGNTNTGGSAQGNGVYRLRRKISSRLRFARPAYERILKPRPTPRPVLSLTEVRYAATHDHVKPGSHHRIRRIRATLRVLGCGDDRRDNFRAMWRRWQLKLGYRGNDANGIPGEASARKLASRAGYLFRA